MLEQGFAMPLLGLIVYVSAAVTLMLNATQVSKGLLMRMVACDSWFGLILCEFGKERMDKISAESDLKAKL